MDQFPGNSTDVTPDAELSRTLIEAAGNVEKITLRGRTDASRRRQRECSDTEWFRAAVAANVAVGCHSYDLLCIVPLGSEVTGLAVGKDSSVAVSAARRLLVLVSIKVLTKGTNVEKPAGIGDKRGVTTQILQLCKSPEHLL